MSLLNCLKPGLSRPTSDERNAFISNSLGSSRLLSERLQRSFSTTPREGLLVMRFHQEWRHDQCPVMSWYNQQCASSTRFQSVEHRRNVASPFYHEFLLLKLADNAICRVERVGDGSRHTDALRYVGCTSHDLIQWFAPDNLIQATASSELIAEINLGREFDILDVLAVCYSIQSVKRCSIYTLQRYNCYFLCLTVLAVLTRRVASWETGITADTWDASVTSVLGGLSDLSMEQAKEHPIMKLCARLEPDSQQPWIHITNPSMDHVTSNAGALADFNTELRKTLWYTSRESSLRVGLSVALGRVPIEALLKDESHCATQLRHAVGVSLEDSIAAILSNNRLAKRVSRVLVRVGQRQFDQIAAVYKDLRHMKKIERPVPFGKLVLSRLLCFGGCMAFLLFPKSVYEHVPGIDPDLAQLTYSHLAARIAFTAHSSSTISTMLLRTLESLENLESASEFADGPETDKLFAQAHEIDELFAQAGNLVLASTTTSTTAEIIDTLDAEEMIALAELPLVLNLTLWPDQFIQSISSLVAPTLSLLISNFLEAESAHLRVHSVYQ
ncbi:hypothetical protein FS749_011514, partial [Ceratobasidium sp. UAMH 11750]